jgi:hypothetical protein
LVIGRVGFILIGLIVSLLVLVLVCEALGWPFLVEPLQRKLASSLDRTVDLSGSPHAVRIRLLGSVRLSASCIEVGAPTWSSEPHTFLANDVVLRLTYAELWQVYRQGRLHIDHLEAEQFDMILRAPGRRPRILGVQAPPTFSVGLGQRPSDLRTPARRLGPRDAPGCEVAAGHHRPIILSETAVDLPGRPRPPSRR